MSDPKIIVALDYDNQEPVIQLIKQLDPKHCRLKIGKELFTSCGPNIVRLVQDQGFEVFLDLKFHDIPATVAKACRSAANLGVWMLNVHALGGESMMKAALSGIAESNYSPYVIAVTLLTSHSQQDIRQIGLTDDIPTQVLRLAKLAHQSGLAGVVCSAQESSMLKKTIASDLICVTPGIRPAGTDNNDQKRVVTPKVALENGSTYLVIGRPITQAKNPQESLMQIVNTL